jgi:TetR/AcrR family transcriptional regulator, mexJK operon transcriptional repressor
LRKSSGGRSARITGGRDGELDMTGTPREVLGRLGLNLLQCRIFYAQGPARVHRELARYLGRAARRRELRCPEPQLAAKLFLGAIVANYQILGLIAPGLEPFKGKKMRAHVEEAVALFLARYGPSR